MNRTEGIVIIVVALLGIVTGFVCGRICYKNPPISPLEPKIDTLYYHDTITALKPVYLERRVIDSVRIPVVDTLRMTDTLFVYLEREQIVWEDSLARIYASGIMPQVDSVRHYTTTREIIKAIPVIEVKRTRWGIGVQAGYGIGKGGLTPYVGVGVSYNLLTW